MKNIKNNQVMESSPFSIEIKKAIMAMDTQELQFLLDNDIPYQDIGKDRFIEELNKKFKKLKSLGDTELLMEKTTCNSCHVGKDSYLFTGNHSNKQFAMFFDLHQGKIKDIYPCLLHAKIDLQRQIL